MRRLRLALIGASILSLALATTTQAGGPPSIGFYVDGSLYRTVGTPTDFSPTGAPDHSYDRIFALGSGLTNVAEAKPGDRDYNGGRWQVYAVTWHVTPYQLTSDSALWSAVGDGHLSVSDQPVRSFECPVIPLGGRR